MQAKTAVRYFGYSLLLLPKSYRKKYGQEIIDVFAQQVKANNYSSYFLWKSIVNMGLCALSMQVPFIQTLGLLMISLTLCSDLLILPITHALESKSPALIGELFINGFVTMTPVNLVLSVLNTLLGVCGIAYALLVLSDKKINFLDSKACKAIFYWFLASFGVLYPLSLNYGGNLYVDNYRAGNLLATTSWSYSYLGSQMIWYALLALLIAPITSFFANRKMQRSR